VKVLYVTHRYPPHTGGIETHVEALATRMVDRGHDVTVLAADRDTSLPTTDQIDGVTVRRFRSFSPGNAFFLAPQIVAAVRRADADVVHAHNYHAFPLLFAAIGVADAALIATPHYHGRSDSGLRDRLLGLYRPVGGWALDRADAVIAVSRWERDRLETDFGIDATVIPNGVSVAKFETATPEQRDRPYILVVGRLDAYKRVQDLIRALPKVPTHDLVVVGTGPAEDALQDVATEAGVPDRVTFLGYVDDDRLPRLYAGADTYLTLSEIEAAGMTVGEALAACTPCVVTTDSGLESWGDHEGVTTVDDRSPDAIAAAIETALDTTVPEGVVMDWDAVASRTEAIYREQL